LIAVAIDRVLSAVQLLAAAIRTTIPQLADYRQKTEAEHRLALNAQCEGWSGQ
jgi:hypothetical protein